MQNLWKVGSVVLLVAFGVGCESIEVKPISEALIPAPQVWVLHHESVLVCGGNWQWTVPEVWSGAQQSWEDWLNADVLNFTGSRIPISVTSNANLPEEGYELVINEQGIHIDAATAHGAFHALTTLRWMRPPNAQKAWAIPYGAMRDAPRFPHRGLLLDCCRHFMEPEYVKRMIDLLALHKMSVLHWHLTEDQGWRIEVDAYPKLTEVGAWRKEADGSTHGGFYTKDQIRDIVAYAASRHITVIPEIELPGHSSAALAAYPWLGCTGESMEVPHDWGVFKDIYCAGQDTTFAFLEIVLDEVMELFPSEYIHIGGDEAPKVRWEACPRCQQRIAEAGLHDEHELQSWFIGRIGRYLEEHGRKLIGWDEILEGGLPAGATVQSWRGMNGGLDAVASGHDAIMSPTSHCYFDYPVESTDLEEVYGFEPVPEGLAGTGRILGGECNMWSEHAPQHLVDSKVFPRLVAMSEVLWSDTASRDWADFKERMEWHYARLESWNVDYGWETVPISMEWSKGSLPGSIQVGFAPAMSGVAGDAQFHPIDDRPDLLGHPISTVQTIQGEGTMKVALNRKGVSMGAPLEFPVAGHVGAFAPIQIDHEINPYYPGRGEQGLADGRLGTLDFRDGSWQAAQGEDMAVQLDLGEPMAIDSMSMQFYRYQDAWIFLPDSIRFQWSADGENWEGSWMVNPFSGGANAFTSNDLQDVNRVSTDVDATARWVRLEARNPGPCPDWHDAASSASWLFLDELVVHTPH